ncbi:MAG: CusA/CzcA family heavy metal efflux RND transporter [Melioribacteraceae bacterium]|nr:CusA/CzcA family heavy metal efflux RND transporter [Melioribacteraceae bacterium]
MIDKLVNYSITHKLIVLLFTLGIVVFGLYSLTQIPIGAVPDVTNNQVQVITTSRNLSTEDVEKYLTYPVELEMTNLPGVVEIRSISKFGLSVVTIVFDDDMGTYLPRQLIAEKIKSAQEKIPKGFGTPYMGPITTGLGEIYQYIIDTDDAHKNTYSISDLRTIQDWIVRRQLSGIKGVVEVNTWGGYLKQYEVAVNPERIRAMRISLSEIYAALENNNSVVGGGYIEKTNQSYFIRGEGLAKSLDDIRNIVVKTKNGVPVYVRDIAEVGFGHATRFGAITANGEGEKVLGQVMMLKDANSKATIDRVKERIAEIQKNLPKGIVINGFLDRSELIDKTTYTITENLILGFLIVIFVVVLLLGNFRSGLVVASIIPLSLLFALSLMYIFGVDANLMSLGAIDFGIIIDGAVIIVEYIAFRITSQGDKLVNLKGKERQSLLDKIAYSSTKKMTRSALFGQLIIIIVFIPILSLTGVEGKMFKPMALVFTFALLGTMILGFTYVPVISSLFLRPIDPNKKTISKRFMAFLMKLYKPSIYWALAHKKIVLTISVLLLTGTSILFVNMGAEFMPTLDEGDFVIQPVLKTGTSLSKTIETLTKMEKIIKQFPEVKDVVSRIGAAEVPTDPMSMEESDVIITLKPKDEWVSAKSKDELADKFKEALSIIPGIDYEFTQPIEMRFNELITGVRADLAIKIFGNDLDILDQKAKEIEAAIQNVDGASDIIVEKTAGLPQMSVIYNRQKIAKYGLNVQDLNNIITMGFAGLTAGTIFEGEKQFDLVIRFDDKHRTSIDDLRKASIALPSGQSLPLSEFAEIKLTKSPAKISRDETRRRIVIGVNVRNRDLASVVEDVQKIINKEIHLPVGYSISYGGQFENLENAKARLMIAVPIALFLIFIMLHFAFSSFKDALIIYSAIPFSAIGGVLLLYFRDLPFSISAGVGFIALFGIAVLNGIVLIEHFKELKEEGISDIHERIILGTKNRLRPVLLTAGAAALGFLPMAVSTNAGAEVQRPLATVVVGGLITATLLTMIVLPVLYSLLDNVKIKIPKVNGKSLPLLLLFLLPIFTYGQNIENKNFLTIDKALSIAIENNAGLKAEALSVKQAESITSLDFPKTDIYYSYDENNMAENNVPLDIWGVNQSFKFPTIYFTQNNRNKEKAKVQKQKYLLSELMLKREVSKAYYSIIYLKNVEVRYQFLDSLLTQFEKGAEMRYLLGETNNLEFLTAKAKKKEIEVLLEQTKEKVNGAYSQLYGWLQTDSNYLIPEIELPIIELTFADTLNNPGLSYYKQMLNTADYEVSLEKQNLLPDINLGLFRGSNNGPNSKNYFGFDVGVSIPLFFFEQSSKIEQTKIERQVIKQNYKDYAIKLNTKIESLISELKTYKSSVDYYQSTGKSLSRELLVNANKAFQNGEIDYFEYILLMHNSILIEMKYLDDLNKYNTTVLSLNYLVLNEL